MCSSPGSEDVLPVRRSERTSKAAQDDSDENYSVSGESSDNEVAAPVKKRASQQRLKKGKQPTSQAQKKKKLKVRVKHSYPGAV